MTLSSSGSRQDLFLSKDTEGYLLPIDFNQLNEIFEISQDILNVEDRDHREYFKEFDELEIEYSTHSFAIGY